MNNKDKIIDTFLSLVSDSHNINISVKNIIDKSNISKNTFYKNFNNKDDIINNLIIKFLTDTKKSFYNMYIELGKPILSPSKCLSIAISSIIPYCYCNYERIKIVDESVIFDYWIKRINTSYTRTLKKIFPYFSNLQLKIFIGFFTSSIFVWYNDSLILPLDRFQKRLLKLYNLKIEKLF
ncbi:TetR/AcrR family transcriptional regulator [Apilactobacillus micheneri]|uniref:TetR/AcrR family transcriptional regulator n=1 Tax=Apilactobacillus micheneri TaxID=1899430 RepID=UPI000D50AF47|nr:TetR/AcrR family transcriptional regulator [Apilactobacillus micheneri]GAY80303.1 hypothetical protein NBRC113063_01175 [Apilactobacillus micheneri]